MSTQDLSNRCGERGLPIGRSVLANFESGRRPAISVPELLVLADSLEVPPVALLCPVDDVERVEILPDKVRPVYEALAWVTGETSSSEDPARVGTYRAHAAAVERWQSSSDELARHVRNMDTDPNAKHLAGWARVEVVEASQAVSRARQDLRTAGLRLPELPDGLRHIDEEGDGQ